MTIKEGTLYSLIAALGTAVSLFLGGWDVAIKVMIFCMITDYVTGLLGAVKTKSVDSEVMFWGGIRKGIILLVVGLAVMLDELIGNDSPIFRTLALYFYIGREGLSIVENMGLLGVPLPAFVGKTLEQLQEKGDEK